MMPSQERQYARHRWGVCRLEERDVMGWVGGTHTGRDGVCGEGSTSRGFACVGPQAYLNFL